MTISVVIPCYNGEAYLAETLQSVLSQTRKPDEIIVIDDGSTDNSRAIAESLGSPIRVISQENQGESVARNRGIDEARGEWIALLDADDLWEPSKLERQVSVIADGVGAVHTKVYRFGAAGGFLKGPELNPDDRYRLDNVASTSPIHPSSLLVRADVCPRFDTNERYGEDTIFQLDLVRRATVVLIDEPLTGYRVHRRNQTATTEMIETRRVEALERWLARHEFELSPEIVGRMRDQLVWRLAGDVRTEKQKRRWHNFESLRQKLLTDYPNHEATRATRKERTYPRFLYRLKDSLSLLAKTAKTKPNRDESS